MTGQDQIVRGAASPGLRFSERIEIGQFPWLMHGKRLLDYAWEIAKPNFSIGERFDRDFVGNAQHSWIRLAGHPCFARQPEGREADKVRFFESERPDARQRKPSKVAGFVTRKRQRELNR